MSDSAASPFLDQFDSSQLKMCRTDSKRSGSSRSSSTVSLLPNYMQNLKEAMERHAVESSPEVEPQSEVQQGLIADACQIQLTLWTVATSTVLAYVWRRRFWPRAVALGCLFLTMVSAISMAALAVVIFAHLFRLRHWSWALGSSGQSDDQQQRKASVDFSSLPLTSLLISSNGSSRSAGRKNSLSSAGSSPPPARSPGSGTSPRLLRRMSTYQETFACLSS